MSAVKLRPKKVKVGYKTYTVQYDCSEGDMVHRGSSRYTGLSDHTGSLIRVASSLTEDEVMNTLIHEMMHGCVWVWGTERKDMNTEESFVNKTANMICTMLIDNPKLRNYINAVCSEAGKV